MGGPRSPGILERLLVVLVVGVSCGLVLPVPAGATLPGRNGKIAIVTEDCNTGCYDDLNVMNPDGTEDATLGPDDDSLDLVAFSPRGEALAYSYLGNIYVGSFRRILASGFPDGTRLTRAKCDYDTRPRWSPTGRTLLFVRLLDYGCISGPDAEAMYKVSVRTKRVSRFGPRFATPKDLHDTNPDWSSRGEIAFEDGPGLWVIDDAGTRRRRLTAGPQDLFPSWSPDGTRLAFTRYKSESSRCGTIYTVRRDGRDLRRLAGGCAQAPAWSPDGRSIAFLKRDYVMAIPAGGGHARRIGAWDGAYTIDWQPLPR
jgi:Tol biopolymer transport system component